MQAKLISQTGLKVRTNCRLGYWSFGPTEPGEKRTDAQRDNDICIKQRDIRSWDCFRAGWPQDVWNCAGNNNGKELDRCMATVWGPEDLKTYRSQGGSPYNSSGGDICFDQFYARHQQGLAIDENKAEWGRCVNTI